MAKLKPKNTLLVVQNSKNFVNRRTSSEMIKGSL